MSLRGWNRKDIVGLRGAWTRLDQVGGRPERARVAQNVRYEPWRVKSRPGHSAALTVLGKVSSMYHWLTHEPNGKVNRLLYFEGGSAVKIRDFIGSSTTTLYSLSGRGFKVAEAGTRLYVAVFNTSVAGAGDVRVVHPLLGGSPTDKAFAPPLAITPVVTDPGAGNCSYGSKRFAYILETRSGYTGKPSPESGGVFFPTTFAVPSDGRQLNMQILGDTPDDAAFYHAIMTTTDNLERWFFVPDGSVAVSGGQTGWNANITIDISDVDLANNATECAANFNYLTQNELSNDPSSVVTYGRRVAYFMFNKVYISEIADFQAITEDQHAVQVPGQKELVTGFQLRGVFYLLGPNWTYAVEDTGDVPRLWGEPRLVSGAIGTIAPYGVEWRTAGDYVWVASQAGLFLFNGSYSEKPISYMNEPEWGRINWAAPYSIFVLDDFVNQRVMVAAPLDTATEPSHILVWDYSRGLTPYTVDFSLDNFDFGEFSSLALIQDKDTNRSEVWVGPDASGSILKVDGDERVDTGTNVIRAVWESGFALGKAARRAHSNRFGGADIDAAGEGFLKSTVYEKGRADFVRPDRFELENPPEDEPQLLFDLATEDVSYRIEVDQPGHWFDLRGIGVYHRPWISE